ncbi:MAG TPA: guanylate kinase [Planctomycetota bacterium]|nr:guanylate kinase [Planctomycetota bacterium]
MTRGKLIVISGPSGVGKTSICDRLLEDPRFRRVVTCTTRPPRETEVPGVDYHFLGREEFEQGIREGRFAEHAEVYGHLYGTPLDDIERGIREGSHMLLNIDVQGARQLRKAPIDGMVTLFIAPPDLETLEKRLRGRGNDTPESIERRLLAAHAELAERDLYDHVIVNESLEQAIRDVLKAIELEPQTEHASAFGGKDPNEKTR